jgi:hypothetical protein
VSAGHLNNYLEGHGHMSDSKISTAGELIAADHDAAKTSPHLRWELQQVMSRVSPDDLSAAEISSLLAILVPAHSRVIGGPAGRPALRVIGIVGEDPAAKLAQ